MQVLCKSSENRVEVRCSVCWNGFAVYWDQQTQTEQTEALEGVVKALKNHSCSGKAPSGAELLWNGPLATAGAARLGNAPN